MTVGCLLPAWVSWIAAYAAMTTGVNCSARAGLRLGLRKDGYH